MEILEPAITTNEFAFGTNDPLSDNVLDEIERFPVASVNTPPTVTLDAKLTPEELDMVQFTPAEDGCPFPINWALAP
ncbi:MAG: hypothetical protein ACK5ZY_06485, partial [Cyclobacteriaceae bacterium]